MSDPRQRAQEYFDGYDATVNAGDLNAWVGTFTDEAVINPPDRAAMQGSDAIRTYGEEVWFGPNRMRLAVTVEEAIPVSDEYLYTRGNWTIDLTPKDCSPSSSVNGTFMFLLRDDGGELKATRAAFSIVD